MFLKSREKVKACPCSVVFTNWSRILRFVVYKATYLSLQIFFPHTNKHVFPFSYLDIFQVDEFSGNDEVQLRLLYKLM